MKTIFTALLLTAINLAVFSQNKTEIGLYTEGSFVMDGELTIKTFSYYNSNPTWGTALGAYASVPIWWRFSIYGALGGRYAQLTEGTAIWTLRESGDGSTLTGYDFYNYKRWYVVAPVNIRFSWPGNCFLSGGIETCWMLNNYDSIKNKPEFNWTVGFGSQKHKLKWNLQYVWGFDKQEVKNYVTSSSGTRLQRLNYSYQTKRLQLTLTYPLWSK